LRDTLKEFRRSRLLPGSGISVELGTNIQPEEKSNIDCILKTVRIDMESLGIEKNTEKGWKSDWERR
jgi:hypothetical protein